MNAKVFGPLFSRVGILPAVAAQDAAVLSAWADAAVDAGVPALELFLRGEGAEAAVTAAIVSLRSSHPTLAIGAGSVYDAATAKRMIDAGARFLVSPITDPATGAAAAAAGIDWLPGAFTPTEIALAAQKEFECWHASIERRISPCRQDRSILCSDRRKDPDAREEWAKYLRFHGGSIPRRALVSRHEDHPSSDWAACD